MIFTINVRMRQSDGTLNTVYFALSIFPVHVFKVWKGLILVGFQNKCAQAFGSGAFILAYNECVGI